MNLMLEIFGGVLWCCWVLTSVSVWIWICFLFFWCLVPGFGFCFWLRRRFNFVGQIRVRVRRHSSICHVESWRCSKGFEFDPTLKETQVCLWMWEWSKRILLHFATQKVMIFSQKLYPYMWVIIIDISTYVKAPDQTNLVVHSSLDLTNLDLTK